MKRHLLCAFVALAGCVDLAHPFTRAASPAVERARTAAREAERARIAALPRVPLGERLDPRLVEAEGRVRHVLAGPVRVDVRGDIFTTADDIPAAPIKLALHAARGWIFATEWGDVYRSDTFTGTLRPLRALACGTPMSSALVASDSHRRVVVMSDDGSPMLWSDGDALHAVDVPGAVAMAWQSESRGALIVGYNALKATRDGGRSWRNVDLGDALPLAVAGRADGLYVETSEGTRLLDARDALTPAEVAGSAPMQPFSLRAVESVYARGYERVPAPSEGCPRAPELETANAWSPPHLVARLPTHREEGIDWPTAPRGAPSPFGTLRGRAFADSLDAPAVVSITRPDDPVAGHPVTLAWRGADERGGFTVRVQTRAPSEVPVQARWAVVAATRTGLLCAIPVLAPGASADIGSIELADRALYWFSAAGVQRLRVGPSRASFSALALDDGGVMLLQRTGRDARALGPLPPVVRAIAIAPDGSVRAQRAVVDAWPLREVVGLGERGGRWGIVTAERATPEVLTFLALDGTHELFGAWTFADVLPACGARDATGARLHQFHRADEGNGHAEFSATIGPQFDGPEYAYARLATFERSARGATCVRRVWGVRQLGDEQDADGSYVDNLWSAFRLTARGGRLVAVVDDGRTVATFPMTLGESSGYAELDH